MRNVLAIIGAATLTFLVVGWYLGWYKISSLPSPHGDKSVQVDINPDKITEDVKKGVERGGEIVDQFRDKSKGESGSSAGPATNFFTPTPTEKDKGSSGGWKPISNSSSK